MPLANFFDKAALAASQILKGFDYDTFKTTLEAHVVGLAFDDTAAASDEGRTTLELAVNLLARLYPRLAIAPHGRQAADLAVDLANAARAINPAIVNDSDLAHVSVVLALGATRFPVDCPIIYVGSDGWIVRLSPTAPVGSGSTNNVFGAAAAACFGAANVFRILFRQHLPDGEPDTAFALSLLDYRKNVPVPLNPPLQLLDLGEVHLAGLGAIGNGAIWVLARMPMLQGVVHGVDKETADLGNLQRYVMTVQADVGQAKTLIAERAMIKTGLRLIPHSQRWGDYLRERQSWRLERVAIALDSWEDRCAIQASLPRWTVNAWTQPGDLGVSRHDFLSDDACVTCLYLPDKEVPSDDILVAQALGIPEAKDDIRVMLFTGAPINRAFIEHVATALDVPVEPLLRFEGQPVRTFYAGAICGGVVLGLGGSTRQRVEAPMAFQSALAGIMLAGELVAHAGGLRTERMPVTTKIDLLRPIGDYLSYPAKKHASGRCICQDPDYIAAFQEKYEASENTRI